MTNRDQEGQVNFTVQKLLKAGHSRTCPRNPGCPLAKSLAYSVGLLDRSKRSLEEREYDAAYTALLLAIRSLTGAIVNEYEFVKSKQLVVEVINDDQGCEG